MRLRRLDLLAYGPFTGATLDFSRSQGRLDLVYGPNEAGKSTALRAIEGLLFGIDAKTGDAHLHPAPKLRIGGEIETAAGERIALVRRKGNKETLLDPAGAVVEDRLLERALGGAGRSLFRALFGLDQHTLTAGARELLAGGGDVGESLFDAGGAHGVHRVLERLRAEAEEIFTPRAKERLLNRALRDHNGARKRAQDLTLPPQKWVEQREALAQAERACEDLAQRRRELKAEQLELQRVLALLRLASKRRELSVRLEACPEPPERLLDLDQAAVDALHGELAALRESRQKRPEHAAALAHCEDDMRTALRELGRPIDDGQLAVAVESLRVDAATLARGDDLGREHAGIAARLAEGEKRLGAAKSKLAAARKTAAALPPPRDVAALERTAARARRERDRLAERRAANDHEHGQLVSKRRALTADLRALEAAGDVPSEADLAAARALRDQRWQALRGSSAALAEELRTFEEALGAADRLADRLWREAERVHRRARLVADLEALGDELLDQETARQSLLQSIRSLEVELGALVGEKDEGLDALCERADALVLAERRQTEEHELRRREIVLLETDVAELTTEHERCLAELAAWQEAWAVVTNRLGLQPSARVSEVAAVRSCLGRLFARAAEAATARALLAAGDAREQRFAEHTSELVAAHLPELAGESPVEAAASLAARHRGASEAALKRAELGRALGEVETELLEQGGGATLSELLELVRGKDAVAAAAREAEIESELEQKDEELDGLKDRIRRLRFTQDEHLASREGAFAAEEDAQAHLATARRLAERYVRVVLAARILEQEIERYRREHQGPLLRRANELFPELTLGTYRELRVEHGPDDAPALRCIERDGKEKTVAELSEGTRDQLYLALRLASIEGYCRRGEPLPLVLDDVLVNFDDGRARAALRLLARLGRETQILFFTHHEHLCALAHEELGDGVREHRLEARLLERDGTAA